MKIAVLSREVKGYTVRRLKETASARGHRLKVLDTLQFSIQVEEKQPDLYYCGKRVLQYDVVIPRIGASITFFGTAVVRQFEQMGMFTLNSSQAIAVSRDKLRSLQVLSRHDIGMPASAFVREKTDVHPAIDRVGGAPVIIKLLEGTQGIGVILAEKAEMAAAVIETLQSTKQQVLIQKFVAESKGRDVRAFVVGGRVVAAMRRQAEGQEFRSNVHRGGKTQRIQLDAAYEQTAVRAAQILGLRVAGVDMLESVDGPQVMEVNSSPGLEGIEKATGVDVAAAIIEHIEEQVLFPEIDLRQRLTVQAGYGVVEFPVDLKSELAGKNIGQTTLRDRDILVLSIDRNGVVIPSPHGTEPILAGDKLLCFGKLLTLKDLVPGRKAKRPKQKQSPLRVGSRR